MFLPDTDEQLVQKIIDHLQISLKEYFKADLKTGLKLTNEELDKQITAFIDRKDYCPIPPTVIINQKIGEVTITITDPVMIDRITKCQ